MTTRLYLKQLLLFSVLLIGCHPQVLWAQTLSEEAKENDQSEVFNQGLLGFDNSFTNGGKVNPKTNIRSLRRTLFFGKEKKETNEGYLVIRHSLNSFYVDFSDNEGIKQSYIENIGSDVLNQTGGVLNISLGQKKIAADIKNGAGFWRWEGSTKLLTFNSSAILETEENQLHSLTFFSGFMEYARIFDLSISGNNSKQMETEFIGISLLGGFSYTPIWKKDHIYYTIFQDDYGNTASTLGFFFNVETQIKLNKILLTAGISGRVPDARIFGLHPRFYFAISSG